MTGTAQIGGGIASVVAGAKVITKPAKQATKGYWEVLTALTVRTSEVGSSRPSRLHPINNLRKARNVLLMVELRWRYFAGSSASVKLLYGKSAWQYKSVKERD